MMAPDPPECTCGCWELNLYLLEDQQVLLTTEPGPFSALLGQSSRWADITFNVLSFWNPVTSGCLGHLCVSVTPIFLLA